MFNHFHFFLVIKYVYELFNSRNLVTNKNDLKQNELKLNPMIGTPQMFYKRLTEPFKVLYRTFYLRLIPLVYEIF